MDLLGEIDIKFGDETHTLKPTFKGVLMIEEKSGKRIGELFQSFIKGAFGLSEVTAIIYGGMYGANENRMPKMSFDQVGEAVLKQGLGSFYECGTFIAAVFSGKSLAEFRKAVDVKVEEPVEKKS